MLPSTPTPQCTLHRRFALFRTVSHLFAPFRTIFGPRTPNAPTLPKLPTLRYTHPLSRDIRATSYPTGRPSLAVIPAAALCSPNVLMQ